MHIRGSEIKRVLIVEPYYGGSHQLFLEGLTRTISAEYTVLSLPARKWKMRMQLSAIWFAQEVAKLAVENRRFDIVLCSTFVDLATLRILLTSIQGWNQQACFLTYFHENQFAYPGKSEDEQIYQYQALNFTTALASDRIAFNSSYNRKSLLNSCMKYLEKAVDMQVSVAIEKLKEKSIVLYPGLDFTELDSLPDGPAQDVPVILWNQRWEHDKNPEELFNTLFHLQEKGVPFKLVIVGQSFRDSPQCFETARSRLEERILHFGYIESRHEYLQWLKKGSVVVSTALQEFFGISVLEAVRAGCRPLVPDRLAYREIFDRNYRYKEGEFSEKLLMALSEDSRLEKSERESITNRYRWDTCKDQYEQWLFCENNGYKNTI